MNYPAHLDLNNETAYQQWRDKKLSCYQQPVSFSAIAIENYKHLTESEKSKLYQDISRYNFSIYRLSSFPEKQHDIPISLAQQFHLLKTDKHLCVDDTGISQIKVSKKRGIGEYIPYTNHAINWHTDGYYNEEDKKIHSMILHCEQNALEGGENAFIDHEIVYILLRDENPDYIKALSDRNSMIIPENRQNNVLIRAEQSGPVFSACSWGLHMRYTARTKSIIWQDDEITRRAVASIREIYHENSVYKIEYRLNPGEGVISNNVMHMRSKFTNGDDEKNTRVFYRMRFYQPLTPLTNSGN